MASVLDLPNEIMTQQIKTEVYRLAQRDGSGREVALSFERLTVDEARTLMVAALSIEQARTGDVLSPTEYGNRFSGLDLEEQ